MTCVLCNEPLDSDTVPFGIFGAHKGCAEDWAHEAWWLEEQRIDDLESQER